MKNENNNVLFRGTFGGISLFKVLQEQSTNENENENVIYELFECL